MDAFQAMDSKTGTNIPSSSASSSSSSESSESSDVDQDLQPDDEPRSNQGICISEEFKLGVKQIIESFQLDESQNELEFSTSLTITERAYVISICTDQGYSHKCRGPSENKYLKIYKVKKQKSSRNWQASSKKSCASPKSSSSQGGNRALLRDAGPGLNEEICISEEVRLGIDQAIERFRLDESQKELEFPPSLTLTERAYVHRICEDQGYAHKSKGSGDNRHLRIIKKEKKEKKKKFSRKASSKDRQTKPIQETLPKPSSDSSSDTNKSSTIHEADEGLLQDVWPRPVQGSLQEDEPRLVEGSVQDVGPGPVQGSLQDVGPRPVQGLLQDVGPGPDQGSLQDVGPRPVQGLLQDVGPGPDQGSLQDDGPGPDQGSLQDVGPRPVQGLLQDVGPGPDQGSLQDVGPRPVQDLLQDVGPGPDQGSLQDVGPRPVQGLLQDVGPGPDQGSVQDVGPRPVQDLLQDVGPGPDQGLLQDVGPRPVQDLLQDVGPGPDQGSLQDVGPRPVQDLLQDVGPGPDQGSLQDVGPRPVQDFLQVVGPGPDQGLLQDVGPGPDQDFLQVVGPGPDQGLLQDVGPDQGLLLDVGSELNQGLLHNVGPSIDQGLLQDVGPGPDQDLLQDVEPRPDEEICIREEVTMGIAVAMERLRLYDTNREYKFPASHLTVREQAYIHRVFQDQGYFPKFKPSSKCKYLRIYKYDKKEKKPKASGKTSSKNSESEPQRRTSPEPPFTSSSASGKSSKSQNAGRDAGPKHNKEICISETVKMSIQQAIESFRLDESQKEYKFPASDLTVREKKYINRIFQEQGYFPKVKRSSESKYLKFYKKEKKPKASGKASTKNSESEPQRRTSPEPPCTSSSASGKSSKSQNAGRDAGPKHNEDICISETVKMSIEQAIESFRLDESQKELEFPNSHLTVTEKAYVHRICLNHGYSHKNKGKGGNKYLLISKGGKKRKASRKASFQLAPGSHYQISSMLEQFPVTDEERLELGPGIVQSQVNEVSEEWPRTVTGRLNQGVSRVPPPCGDSPLKTFTHSLPIHQYHEDIMTTINHHQVSLISGETGSGKTTQVPQMILDKCCQAKKPCRIFCTQPRRIAALSISERVAAERGERVGQTVGYQIRLESRVSAKTLLVFCTNGVLLRTLMGNEKALDTVTHVIVDEVHERDKFSDFLLISLREMLKRNPTLKVILMSATMDTVLFQQYFDGCATVSVPGNLFHVEEYFIEDVLKWTGYSSKKMDIYKQTRKKETNGPQQLSQDPKGKQQKSIDNTEQKLDDGAVPTEQLAMLGLGPGKEEVEPWVRQEMEQLMSQVWLTGSEELFPQIVHLIVSENVSVDYKHPQTSVTPLMIAAGRGFTDMVSQLLTLGADPELISYNDWTALSWSQKFHREEVVALLEAHIAARGQHVVPAEEELSVAGLSAEDRELLSVYQHCWDDDRVDIDLIASLLYKIMVTQPEGAVLIFLPGYDDIVSLSSVINEDGRFGRCSRYSLFLLHSAMHTADQKMVFQSSPPGVRKIILATNIAETSITINDVVYVIDAGKIKEKSFDGLQQITMLKSNWVSKASAVQRRGRAGRLRPGVCYHMFSKARFQRMLDNATPELLRCPLQELCLQTKLLAGVNESIADFLAKAPEAPPQPIVRSAVSILKEMDALDQSENLTELGRHLANLPVEPHLGKMVLNAIVLKCLDPVLTIVCSLSYKSPFLLPTQPLEKRNISIIQKAFAGESFSDHMALLQAFQAWQWARAEGWEKDFCCRNYISSAVMEMIVGMRSQLIGQLRATGFVRARGGGDMRDLNTNAENWPVIKAALCAGAYPSIIRVDRQKKKKDIKLVGQMKEKVIIHMSSVLPQRQAMADLPTDWLFYEEMTRAGTLACVRCCTAVTAVTVAILAGPATLPPYAVKDSKQKGNEKSVTGDNSVNDDPGVNKSSMLKLSSWLAFTIDQEGAGLILQLRQKYHSLFLRRMRDPSLPCSEMDEAVVSAIVNVLTNEEPALGLEQHAAIEETSRTTCESPCLSTSAKDNFSTSAGKSFSTSAKDNLSTSAVKRFSTSAKDNFSTSSRKSFSTSAKKATSTSPKREDCLKPAQYKDQDSFHEGECHFDQGNCRDT